MAASALLALAPCAAAAQTASPPPDTPACAGPSRDGTAKNVDLVVAIQRDTAWRPRGGEVRLDVSGKAGVQQIKVCFEWSEAPAIGRVSPNVRHLSAADGASTNTDTVSFGATVPDLRETKSGWWNRVVSGSADAAGLGTVPLANMVVTITPSAGGEPLTFVRPIGVTSVDGSVLLVLILLVLFYALIKVLSSQVKPRPPGGVVGPILWLITGADGFASLSQFQIILWTVTVAASAVYVMALSGTLIDIPAQMLQLLGIAGGAALLARVPPKGGLRDATRAPTQAAHWSDLVVLDGGVDVTRIQMLIFTLISAAFVMLKVIVDYQITDVPQNFVLLMGISNGVYLAGRHLPESSAAAPAGATGTQALAPTTASGALQTVVNRPP